METFRRVLTDVVDRLGGREKIAGQPPDRVTPGDLSNFLSGGKLPGWTVVARICDIAKRNDRARERLNDLITSWDYEKARAQHARALKMRAKYVGGEWAPEPGDEDDEDEAAEFAAGVSAKIADLTALIGTEDDRAAVATLIDLVMHHPWLATKLLTYGTDLRSAKEG